MKLKFIKQSLLIAAFGLAFTSCENDDQTGDSLQTPSNPTVSIDLGFSSPVVLLEDDQVFEYTVTLSETQFVDTSLYVSQVGGTADDHDYEMTSLITIPAGHTTGMGSIKILADDLVEDVETLTIQIGDQRTSNSSMTPVTVSFTISNATSDDLVIGLNWASSTTITDTSGEEVDATDLADMRLLVTNSPYTSIVGGADGGSFETYEFSGANADNEYLVVADFYAALEGEANYRDLDLEVTFDQIGKINHLSYSFPAVINTAFTCPNNYTVLAKVVKTGGDYEITPVGETNSIDVEGDWTIEMNDDWGDGWNGGFLTVSVNGNETTHAAVGASTTDVVSVPAGATLVITYTAGDYEEENTYTITAPDGTVYSDGPTPTVGTVLDSSNVCN